MCQERLVVLICHQEQVSARRPCTTATSRLIQRRYPHINYLFCNAGILSSCGLNWKTIFVGFFTDPVGLFERSDATIQTVGEINEDGMGKVFAANVFGHYTMVSRDLCFGVYRPT